MKARTDTRGMSMTTETKMERRVAELEAALVPFVEAFDMFAKNPELTRVLSLGQLGRLAAGELSGAHFQIACRVLKKST